ncbi:MAG TPA: hypothetical protein VLH08_07465, partial [Acidobacteriota bacterium]|nr:hypothetical protein [Acidobacteriota bacterium]
DASNARNLRVEVVLSEGAIDAKAAAADLDPHVNVINQKDVSSANYILLWVTPDGKVSMNATLSENMTQFVDSTNDGLKADLTANTAERIAGHVYTVKPVKTMSGASYEVDVTFDTAVHKRAPGTKIAAGGGDAGKAFLALYDGVQRKNMDAIRANVTEAVFNSYNADYRSPQENLDYAVEILSARLPKKNIKITGGEMIGDRAVLEVEGERFEGMNWLFLVTMIKGASGWQYEDSLGAGLLK